MVEELPPGNALYPTMLLLQKEQYCNVEYGRGFHRRTLIDEEEKEVQSCIAYDGSQQITSDECQEFDKHYSDLTPRESIGRRWVIQLERTWKCFKICYHAEIAVAVPGFPVGAAALSGLRTSDPHACVPTHRYCSGPLSITWLKTPYAQRHAAAPPFAPIHESGQEVL